MREPAYFRVLREHFKHAPLAPGLVTHVEVYHDDDCGVWKGAICDCTPEIASGPAIQAKYEGEGEA